jgi:DNA polymerase III alpha subunit
MGLRYVKDLRRVAGEAIVQELNSHGPFQSVEDVRHRVPELHADVAESSVVGLILDDRF